MSRNQREGRYFGKADLWLNTKIGDIRVTGRKPHRRAAIGLRQWFRRVASLDWS